ncbi:MAG: hypothetical protein K0V04_02400 [Deltaproteobacteria bacterium]|nr:hypothetical protein [Deltaproteobacteria bacterium]
MKKRRNWGLLGLLGLGGLLAMMGAADSDDDDESGTDGPGGTAPDGPGGTEPTGPDEPTAGLVWPPPGTPTPKPNPPTTTGGQKPPTTTWGGIDPPRVPPPTDDDDPPRVPPPTDDDDDPPRVPPPSVQEPPWTELVDPYPRGATFYPVVRDDRFGGTSSNHSIAYRYLLSEAFLSAREIGKLDEDEALTWASAVAKQDKVRLAVIDLVQCSGWNDAMYGANPVTQSHASDHGRSILLRPVHGPTASLLENEETPFRNVTLGGNPADGDYRGYELLWMPGIDRTTLWESGGTVLSTSGVLWPDGTSMENPPPWVMALGMDDTSGALEGDFGCLGSDGELEVS